MLLLAETVMQPVVPAEPQISEVAVMRDLFPDAMHVLWFMLFVIGGVVTGILIRKIFIFLALHEARIHGNAVLKHRKVFTRSIFETIAGTSIFVFSGIGVIAYREFIFSAGEISPEVDTILARLLWVFVICAQTVFLWNFTRLPLAIIQKYSHSGNKSLATLLPLVEAISKLLIVALGILMLIRITTNTQPAEIIAMLGVGGLAIGLAAQDSVKNFFGSIMLIFDRPFQVGDLIDIDGTHVGSVEKIGVRSTRVRAIDGALHVIPNGDLANRSIRTISARKNIRNDFNIGLAYETPPEKIDEAIRIIKEILNDPRCINDATRVPRVHFSGFADSSITLRITYHFASIDYSAFLEFNHDVNMQILKKFTAAGIAFAYPTRIIYNK